MAEGKGKVITLLCERAVDVAPICDANGKLRDGDADVSVIKFPCSGMIQPLMIEAALKSGASGVIVCGCQIGDCYYREGNKMIRERLLGGRPPGLKKTVDRRRVIALWLSRPQTKRFLDDTKEFISYLGTLPAAEVAPPPAVKPAAKPPAAAQPATSTAAESPPAGTPDPAMPKTPSDAASAAPASDKPGTVDSPGKSEPDRSNVDASTPAPEKPMAEQAAEAENKEKKE
jgi:coenzyme F420-reducing hydrogenase delta subunit